MSDHTHENTTFGPARSKRPSPWVVLSASALLVSLDFIAGPLYAVSVFFVLPVIHAAWYQGLKFSCWLALALSILRFFCHWGWGFPFDLNPALVNNALRAVLLVLVAVLTDQLAAQMRKILERQRLLENRLPVCPHCGVACREDGQWLPLDAHSALSKTVTPGTLCPDCERRSYDVQPGA